MPDDRPLKRPTWLAVATLLGSSAAVLLGLLYAFGATVEWRRMSLAHVSVIDGLSVLPLPHLLAAGIGLLLTSLLAIALLTAIVLVLIWLERYLEPALQLLRRRHREVKSVNVGVWLQTRDVETELARANALRAQLEATSSASEEAPLRSELETIFAQRDSMRAKLKENKDTLRKLSRRLRIEGVVLTLAGPALRYGPLAIGGAIGVFLLGPPTAISLVISGVVWRLSPHTELRSLLVMLYLVVGSGVIINGILSVSALPVARVVTATGVLTGPLVAVTDSEWYIVGTHREINVVSAARVLSGSYRAAPARHRSTIADLVADLL